MKIADLIKKALEQKDLPAGKLRDAAKLLGISVELLRVILTKGHIPKDKTLCKIAGRLGMNPSAMILAAHREKVPVELQSYFLSAAMEKSSGRKRVFPLSEEQCAYLEKIMNHDEIEILRKFRQVPKEAQTQVIGYVDYVFASKRTTVPSPIYQEVPQHAGE